MMNAEHIIIPLIAGFILDAFLGDPCWLPQPVVMFGNGIYFVDRHFNKGTNRKLKGALSAIILIGLAYGLFYGIIKLSHLDQYAFYIVSSIAVFFGLANHGLIRECVKVHRALEKEGLEAGRKQLSMIVGRDTSKLTSAQIRVAVLETLSENLSDGVIAPMFYYAIGGVPLMFAYKMVNTLDSMIGYKSEKFKEFGWFAARFDDLANIVPARLTALLMVVVTFSWRGIKFIFKYGHQHASPNAGYPEAALAGILNCRFGGPNVYHGHLVNKPYIGTNDRPVEAADVVKGSVINALVSLFFLALIIAYYVWN